MRTPGTAALESGQKGLKLSVGVEWTVGGTVGRENKLGRKSFRG